MKTVTKRDIVRHVTDKMEKYTQEQVQAIVQETLDHITASLASGDQVVLRNFGVFGIRRTEAKVGRNPKVKGSEVRIPPRAVVKFRPGKEMRDRVAQVLPHLDESIRKNA